MFRISNIKIRENLDNQEIFDFVVRKNKIKKEDIVNWHISKRSIDARKKNDVHYTYSIDIELKNEHKYEHKFESKRTKTSKD